jgi:endoglucanase
MAVVIKRTSTHLVYLPIFLFSLLAPNVRPDVRYTGVNLAGAEFGTVAASGGALPGTFGSQYTYPNQTEVDYFRGKGMNTLRLCFRWERLQRATNANFDSAEFNRLHMFVAQTTAKGMYVILNPHNFARYYPDISTFSTMQSGSVGVIGSSAVPNSAFVDFWSRLAGIYKTNRFVIFGLMNEPNALPASQWVSAANAAIAGIRGTGATNLILVPGISWTGAHSWVSSGNSVAMLGIVDSGNNYAFEVHQYLDSDSSGSTTNIVNQNIGVTRISGFTQWLKTNNRKGFLGEFGAANSMVGASSWQIGDEALTNMLSYIRTNADVWSGWTWWAAGPWWGEYIFTLEPTTGGADRPVMPILKNFIPIPAPLLNLKGTNQFQFITQPGFVYQPETVSNLVSGFWSNSRPPVYGNGNTATVNMSVGSGPQGFYRVRINHVP